MPMQFCLKSLWFSYLLCLCCNCKESRLGNAFLSSLCSGNVHKSRSVPALSLEGCACVPLNFTLILLLFVGFLHFTNCSSCRHTWDIASLVPVALSFVQTLPGVLQIVQSWLLLPFCCQQYLSSVWLRNICIHCDHKAHGNVNAISPSM